MNMICCHLKSNEYDIVNKPTAVYFHDTVCLCTNVHRLINSSQFTRTPIYFLAAAFLGLAAFFALGFAGAFFLAGDLAAFLGFFSAAALGFLGDFAFFALGLATFFSPAGFLVAAFLGFFTEVAFLGFVAFFALGFLAAFS
eukprot:CAMPEP_0203761516 /NCGR_PEP_ID=MMETSP0098-20131031/14588_1 /ASSEMBLY_ACC=CAM_ASM_000208 /TAXON_ID=96639 /ORGANISM=" , Strain NY0313808BC1" /LENGTH=140 /DNA_ID=CAMNT_0050655541 /DNA_START=24 /DNA_END=442 /DNA_ORIENTATION=-